MNEEREREKLYQTKIQPFSRSHQIKRQNHDIAFLQVYKQMRSIINKEYHHQLDTVVEMFFICCFVSFSLLFWLLTRAFYPIRLLVAVIFLFSFAFVFANISCIHTVYINTHAHSIFVLPNNHHKSSEIELISVTLFLFLGFSSVYFSRVFVVILFFFCYCWLGSYKHLIYYNIPMIKPIILYS